MMDDTKRARILCCQNCWKGYRVYRGSVFPRCAAGVLLSGGEPGIFLDDGYMEGPPENCPLNLWKDLVPVPLPEPRQDIAERANRFLLKNEPWLRRLDAVARADVLVEMVGVGFPLELAKATGEQLGLNLTRRLEE